MSHRSQRSIKSRRRLSLKHKYRTAKNNKQTLKTMSRMVKLDLKKQKKQMDDQIELRNISIIKGDLEMYAYSNKILLLMILDLAASGTKKAAKLANEYSEKTGIKIDKKKLKQRMSLLPTAKNTVKKIQNTANHPDYGSIAVGWRW